MGIGMRIGVARGIGVEQAKRACKTYVVVVYQP